MQTYLDSAIKGFGKNMARFAPDFYLQTKEYATFGAMEGLFFSFEHYLDCEVSLISFDISFRIKSLKSDEILCKAIGVDFPDLEFRALNKEFSLRSFPFSFKSMEFESLQELQEFDLANLSKQSCKDILKAYERSMQDLFTAFRVDTNNEIKGLYDFIYKYEENADVVWYDKHLMQILLLIELGDKKEALRLLEQDHRDLENEREIFVEYEEDEAMEIFKILEYALHKDIV